MGGYDKSLTYPKGGANGGAQIGNLTVRCPNGCNGAGYGEDVNGFCAECVPNNDRYYINGGLCTTAECNNAGSTEYYNISAVYTDNVCSVATCAKGTKPAADQLSCDSCATVSGSYYTTAGDCTTVSCTPPAATEYFDKSAVYTADTCSVATCAKGTKPAADGLSCEDETKSKVSETGDDAMIGTIMISETGDDAMVGTIMIVGSVIGALVLLAVVGIVVFCVIKPKRNIKPKRKNNRRDLGNRESKFDVELSYE